jgi:RHS repeat-associated protein
MNTLRGIAGRTLTYSDEDHLLTTGGVTYEYDLDGFLTKKTDGTNLTAYDYSSRGELLSVILPDGTAIEYLHDPLGRRIAKRVNGVIVKKYLWHGMTRLLAVYDGSNNLLMRFKYAEGRMPVSMMRSDGTYYFTYDQVGSLRVVADNTGTAVKIIDYDSFGNIINDTNPSFVIPFGFAGGLHDRNTGLVRFGYRDYDPNIGRWTAKDPLLFGSGDTDLFGYCLNDPVNLIDPNGKFGIAGSIFGGITGSISGAITGGLTGGAPGMVAGFAAGGIAGFVVGFINPWGGTLAGTLVGEAIGSTLSDALNPSPLMDNAQLEWERHMEQLKKELEEKNKRLDELLDKVTEINNIMGGPLEDDPC